MSDDGTTKPKLTPEAIANLVGFFDALILIDKELNLTRKEHRDATSFVESNSVDDTQTNRPSAEPLANRRPKGQKIRAT